MLNSCAIFLFLFFLSSKIMSFFRYFANGFLFIFSQASLRERYGVDITPLTYIPGGRIDKYLGNLNFFFIRESTSIRENGGISGFVHNFITEVHFEHTELFAMLINYLTNLLNFVSISVACCGASACHSSWRQCDGFVLHV